ncbi:hypothetical protein ACHHRT_04100 [Desulfurivibrio sp. D14AmB]|uniref:hypothetical protein n=1 Tax=Desulfurivibrio sp. D14AmB TaxID=3374370 RepID=UPI00376F3636
MPVEDYRRLAAAILADALHDLSTGTPRQRWNAARFLCSGCCQFWLSVAGFESDQARRGLQKVRPLIEKILEAGKP